MRKSRESTSAAAASTKQVKTGQTKTKLTSRSPEARANQENFYQTVKDNLWVKAHGLLSESLKNLKILIDERRPNELDGESVRFIKTNVRAGEYFDLLHSPEFKWLKIYLKSAFALVGEAERRVAATNFKDGGEAARMTIFDWLHLAMSHVLIEFRNPGENHALSHQLLERVVEVAKKIELKEAGTGKIASETESDEIKRSVASFWSRLFYLRYMVATRRQERRQADQFLRLAEHYLDLQASFDKKQEQNVLQLKNTKLALAGCWLEISNGQYRFARQLLDLIKPQLKADDPLGKFEYGLAESVCLRCLKSNSAESLNAAFNKINNEIEELHKTFADKRIFYRLVLRGYYEQALCRLLMLGLESNERVRTRYFNDLDRLIGMLSQGNLRHDPSWAAQIEILKSRVAMQRGENLSVAEKHAQKAVDLISDAPLKLLQIEARIALAVTFLRQEKYSDAVDLLNESLALSEETKLLAESSEFNQPALRAVSYLYLARIYVRQKNNVAALENLEKFRRMKDKVEHDWVLSRLAPEIEREVTLQCLVGVPDDEDANLDLQLSWLRRASIEKASRGLQTPRASQIAEKLKITPQMLNGWIRDLQENDFEVGLYDNKTRRQADDELENQKQAIENAMSILDSKNKAEIARFLQISRPTFYKRLQQLKEAGLEINLD